MEAEAITNDDIESCSENEGSTAGALTSRPSARLNPTGAAGRFASYYDAKVSEGGQCDVAEAGDVKTLEGEIEDWLGPSTKAESFHDDGPIDPDDPADPCLEEVHVNNDGTISGGPASANNLEDWEEEALILNSDASTGAGAIAMEKALPAEDSDDSADAEEVDGQMPGEPPLPEEAWKDRPAAERELWERVRPRALRREAARVKELKLPTTTVNRLMKVHPDLQTKAPDTIEIINNATVLLVQSLSQACVRGRKAAGLTVKLEDVKQVCLSNRELHFLLPLSATLDASTLATISRHEADDGNVAGTGRKGGSAQVTAAAPGQGTLSSAAFSRATSSNVDEAAPEMHAAHGGMDASDVATVPGNLDKTPQKQSNKSSKRKLPPSAKKAANNKVPRQTVATGMASLFKQTEAS